MEDTGEGKVLSVLRWGWGNALALAWLAECILLLRWALWTLWIWLWWRHLERAKHGYLDCLWMVNVGRRLLVCWWSVVSVEMVEHVALLCW